VWRADARSRKRDRPKGVIQSFHVSLYKVDPSIRVLTRNLFTINSFRFALADKVEPRGPQMPLVSKPAAFACLAERLAGARACPNSRSVRNPSDAQRVGPDADTCEEVTLSESGKVAGSHIFD
jgi:hypothetical protein